MYVKSRLNVKCRKSLRKDVGNNQKLSILVIILQKNWMRYNKITKKYRKGVVFFMRKSHHALVLLLVLCLLIQPLTVSAFHTGRTAARYGQPVKAPQRQILPERRFIRSPFRLHRFLMTRPTASLSISITSPQDRLYQYCRYQAHRLQVCRKADL